MKEQDLGFLVHVIANHIHRNVNREMEQFGITSRQGKFLGYLNDHKGHNVSQKELQNYFDITHPTTVGIVQRLEAKGFVRTRIDEKDKRSRIVELTAGEQKIHKAMIMLRAKTEKELFNGFSTEEREQLINLLLRVYRNTSGEPIK